MWGRRWVGPPSVDGKGQAKDCQNEKAKCGRVRFEVSKLKDLEVRSAFKLALHSRFEGPQQLMEEEERSVDDEWRLIKQGYVETCEQVLGRAKAIRKEWISKETWEVIEQRNVANNTMNMARMREEERCSRKMQTKGTKSCIGR